jgi:hypothetical protein
MYFGNDRSINKKVYTGFRLSLETLGQIDYLLEKDKHKLKDLCSRRVTRTTIVEHLVWMALSETERYEVKNRLKK